MARPPRIAVRLPWEADVIYFMTICVDRREKVLANLPLFELLRSAFLKRVLRRISWVEGRIFLVQNPSLVAEVEGVLNEKNALVLGV